ncbi:hypothetical protein OESDEN_02930 [Oesophagostomum dentatum]|uniref:Uncharacterized protein n=1 Tax=Oesophagostomum dentatum TaxID=61180 RepID=A0A0B1TNZ6_OESDE|nr:hypothetical protein OESDEN_02930 [Oesophagostomum dentatum]
MLMPEVVIQSLVISRGISREAAERMMRGTHSESIVSSSRSTCEPNYSQSPGTAYNNGLQIKESLWPAQTQIRKVSKRLQGQCGFMFTLSSKAKVLSTRCVLLIVDYARAGFIAREAISIPEGPPPQFSFSTDR